MKRLVDNPAKIFVQPLFFLSALVLTCTHAIAGTTVSPIAVAIATHAAIDYLSLPEKPAVDQTTFLQSKNIQSGTDVAKLFAQYVAAGQTVKSEGVDPSSPYFIDGLNVALGVKLTQAPSATNQSVVAISAPANTDTPTPPVTGNNSNDTPQPSPPDPVTFLQARGISTSSRATIVTAEVLAGYSVIDKQSNAIGYKLTAALPVGTPSIPDYITAQILQRDGGLLNFYISPLSMSPTAWPVKTSHLYDTDKWYFKQDPTWDSLLFYMRDGIGMKGYKPGIATSTSDFTMDPIGSAYLGFGVDGTSFSATDATKGTIALEAIASFNVTNKRILDRLYSTTAAQTEFSTCGAAFSLTLDSYVIRAFYSMSLGPKSRTHSFADDVGGISVTYNGKSATSTTTPGSGKK